ncbi:transposase [Streptomyces sp. NPDC059744]|uniref:transposase n=1 Tax=Streptomyces sp. NPDC059744 TaxID=3346929 RepID=UPI003660D586
MVPLLPARPPREARSWVTAHGDRIELRLLPPHSPELNPDELVNADLKRSLPMPPRPAGSSSAVNANPTSSATTSAAPTSATP